MYTLSVNSVSDSNSWLFRKYILHGCSVHQWKKCVITMLRHSKNLILQHSSNNTCCSSLLWYMNPTIACPLECGVLLQPVDDSSDCCINITHNKHNYFLIYFFCQLQTLVTWSIDVCSAGLPHRIWWRSNVSTTESVTLLIDHHSWSTECLLLMPVV